MNKLAVNTPPDSPAVALENSGGAALSEMPIRQTLVDPLRDGYRRMVPVNAWATILVVLLTSANLYGAVPDILLLPWLLMQLACASYMLFALWRGQRRINLAAETKTPRTAYERVFSPRRLAVLWAGLSGLLWGVGVVFLPGLPGDQQTFLLIVAAAMVSGAATTLAPLPGAATAFIITTVTPYAAFFLQQGTTSHRLLGITAVVFAGAMVAASRVVYSVIEQNRALRVQNLRFYDRIRAAQANLLDVTESVEAFALCDAAGRLTLWNRKLAELLGLGQEKLHAGASLEALLEAGGLPLAALEREAPLLLPSNRWVRGLLRQTKQGDRALILLDITEQHKANELLARQNAELERLVVELRTARDAAERASRAKSSFLANMSHELRTPLNAVIGFADIVRQQLYGPDSPKYQEYVRDIHASATHLLGIIDDILDLARVEANRIPVRDDTIKVADLAATCIRLASAAPSGEGKLVHAEVPADLPGLRADARLLRQTLLNLIGNALKFSAPGGVVSIGAAPVVGGGLDIWVQDGGIGIAPADSEQVFAPFEQVEAARSRQFGGVGLGLALVRAYMEAHGGAVSLRSDLGQGTRVTVHFPPDRVIDGPPKPPPVSE
ncbi:sensor histidine kinase [Ferrovibrio sp.]|uniref:sensor histidine kinase n=2 Tax=Ferrovibrio sp. TaxID=1917215 RepID=UPI0035B44E89